MSEESQRSRGGRPSAESASPEAGPGRGAPPDEPDVAEGSQPGDPRPGREGEDRHPAGAGTGGSHGASASVEKADEGPSADEKASSEREPSPEAMEERAAEGFLAAEMDRLQQELGSLNDRHLRLAAEFSNYRRRAESEARETWTRAQAELLRRFLDVLDDLQRVSALDAATTTVEALVEGVDLVERKFVRALEDAGVEVLEPEGESFDPAIMEAMIRVPAGSEEDDDRVEQVLQRGYRLRGHLVRPARVSVLKHE